ncbi:VWA domain-containing protein [Candidatus Parvarchaeota archaeon]|nr:VWA domain-containing protein [Candidatus Parvarchaeota archaeon]
MKEEKRAALLCARLTFRFDKAAYQSYQISCAKIGAHLKSILQFVPPTQFRMADCRFEGRGKLNLVRTISNFCTVGKTPFAIVERKRTQSIRKLNLAILYDNSNSMTGWWRTDILSKSVLEDTSAQTYAKVAASALCSALGQNKNVDISFVVYGSDAQYFERLDTRKFLGCNGGGATRLDCALEELEKSRWNLKAGAKYILVLTDGVPEAGKSEFAQDLAVQKKSLALIERLKKQRIGVLYACIANEPKLANKTIGGYNLHTYANELKKARVKYVKIEKLDALAWSLFKGFKELGGFDNG